MPLRFVLADLSQLRHYRFVTDLIAAIIIISCQQTYQVDKFTNSTVSFSSELTVRVFSSWSKQNTIDLLFPMFVRNQNSNSSFEIIQVNSADWHVSVPF